MFIGDGISPPHWWAKGDGAAMELGASLAAAGAVQGKAQRHQRPVQPRRRRRPRPVHRQHPLRAPPCSAAASSAAASAWTRCWPSTSRKTPPCRAWCSAASSRSAASTRASIRWSTPRTFPGGTPIRRSRSSSIPSLAFDSLFGSKTGKLQGSILDDVRDQAKDIARPGQRFGPGQDRRIPDVASARPNSTSSGSTSRRRKTTPAIAASRAPARRSAQGLPRIRQADVRHHRPGVPDRPLADRHAADVARPVRPGLSVPQHPRRPPQLLALQHRARVPGDRQVPRRAVRLPRRQLAKMQEGDGTVLDNSCIMFVSEHWNAHNGTRCRWSWRAASAAR